MKLFLSDLDNTLIYSQRRELGDAKNNVEWYEGRQISFMTVRTQTLLQKLRKKLLVLPCTTRSIAQYQRISLLPPLAARAGAGSQRRYLARAWNGGANVVCRKQKLL